MSIQKIHLRKLLTIFYADKPLRITILRADIRADMAKGNGGSSDGGDFYGLFWADAKNFAAGKLDLLTQTKARISSNERRHRLYPLLTTGFLKWWNEKRRWSNEAFEFMPESLKAQHPVPEFNSIVKVENLLSLKIGESSSRIIYPYFSEEPPLPEEGVRVGLWLLKEALPSFPLADMRILDMLRATSFGEIDCPLQGDEKAIFLDRYGTALTDWEKLKKDY